MCEQLIVAFVAAREKMNCSQEVSTKRRMGLGRKSLPAEPMLEHGQYINSNFQLKPRPTLKITGFLIWERGETKELVVLLRSRNKLDLAYLSHEVMFRRLLKRAKS